MTGVSCPPLWLCIIDAFSASTPTTSVSEMPFSAAFLLLVVNPRANCGSVLIVVAHTPSPPGSCVVKLR